MTRGTFVLVGCGAAKADERRQARDLYTSNYFALKRQYADVATQWAGKNQANAWAILSADHGIVPSTLEIDPYDTTVEDLDAPAPEHILESDASAFRDAETKLDLWADCVRSALTTWLNHPFRTDNDPRDSPCGSLVVLAGEKYVAPLEARDVFKGNVDDGSGAKGPGLPVLPEFPFREHEFDGIGDQMAWLKAEAQRLAADAAPARRDELSSYDAGYERERALWQVDRPGVDVEGTEQASLETFEDVPDRYRATEQRTLPVATDGGEE